MTATNHAITGALIGLAVVSPVVAIPAAIVSHFALDAIPHFGFSDKKLIGSDRFAVMLAVEALLCFTLVIVLCSVRPLHWQVAAVCAFAAAAPDFMWVPSFLRTRNGQRQKPYRHVLIFHHVIQWFQRPIGAAVELVWLAGAIFLLAGYL